MKTVLPATAVLTLIFTAAGCSRGEAPPAGAAACDRTCLISALDHYLAAVTAHDPDSARFAEGFRETQNAVDTQPGEGIWTSIASLGSGVRYADPDSGEAGYFGTVEEPTGTAIVAVRVKLDGGALSEAEWILAREGMALYRPAAFVQLLPRTRRAAGSKPLAREAAIAVANSYFEGIDESNGALVQAHPECFRIENGSHMVGRRADQPAHTEDRPAGDGLSGAIAAGISSCPRGFENLAQVTEDVIDRRFFHDAEAGVVWGHGTVTRVPGYLTREGKTLPRLNFVEIFEIDDAQIRGIYAAMDYLPAHIEGSGWAGPDE